MLFGAFSGRFENPSKQGLLYMMSSENRLPAGDGTTQSFPPHLMFYAPNMTTKDIGFDSEPKLDYLGMTHPGAADNLLVVVPTPPTPQAASTPDAGPTKENALEAAKELAQAMRTNDPDGFCRLLDPDWAIVDGFGEIQEDKAMSDGTVKKDICAAIRNGTFTRKTYDMDFANARVRIYGNIATVTAKLSLSGPSGHNNPPSLDKWSGKEVETDVLKWEDGGWKDILTHETNVKDTLKIEKNPEK